ncbi:MAG: hypothetical protein KJZ80_00565 [Hyphomicrobiaceae bacterium]|nr:hypothetical protein [Hyphomicrobiaceae bacterium]
MSPEAPAILIALEQSGLGMAIRQSVWVYPAANVAHVLALTVLAGSVSVMDLRLLGAFRETAPAAVIAPARRVALLALSAMVFTGLVLFTAEASHVAMNPVFQVKMGLIALGVLNALIVQRSLASVLAKTPAMTALALRFRTAAVLSLAIWFCVAASGRFIAYF